MFQLIHRLLFAMILPLASFSPSTVNVEKSSSRHQNPAGVLCHKVSGTFLVSVPRTCPQLQVHFFLGSPTQSRPSRPGILLAVPPRLTQPILSPLWVATPLSQSFVLRTPNQPPRAVLFLKSCFVSPTVPSTR